MSAPFFLVGSGRCGSTWLYRVLRDHPRIALTNEARVFEFVYHCNLLAGTPHTETVDLGTRDGIVMQGVVNASEVELFNPIYTRHAKATVEEFYAARFADKDIAWWGDKLPDPRAAATMRYAWPDAHYLILVRDPRDVLCSWRAHAARPHIARDFPELTKLDPAEFGRTWRAIYDGFDEQLAEPASMTLRYEDLCAAPRERITEVLTFLGLSWTDEVERAFADDAGFATHGTSRDLAATTGRWQRDLGANDRAALEAVCREQMVRYGYLD